MRLHGYCTGCRRIKLVSVTGHGLAMAGATRGVVQGTCAECEENDRTRRQAKHPRH